MKRRYPGPRAFSYDERDLFKGRDHEIEYVSTLITNHRTTVLHGKSGYGKSSLLNAGIIPELLRTFNCEIIRVRLYDYERKNFLRPRDTLLKALEIQQCSNELFLHHLIVNGQPSAWRYFKKMQAEATKKVKVGDEQTNVSTLTYILLFDQFEELFTYPKDYVHEFGKELYDVLQNRTPREFQEILINAYNKDKESVLHYQDELNILEKDVPVKIIFSIRSDRFNYLPYLADYIPGLLGNTYKLKRMSEKQVRNAILGPAEAVNGFDCVSFTYDTFLLNHIVDFLSTSYEQDERKIETFEMQIICSALEEIVIKYFKKEDPNPILTESIIIEQSQIKNSKKLFIGLIKNYYKHLILSIENESERLAARFLIEERLIDNITKSRISLDSAFIQRLGICEETLRYLIDKRIIRIEVSSASSRSFEISHGSLVIPIMDAVADLGNLDKQIYSFFQKIIENYNKKVRKNVIRALFDLLAGEKEDDDLVKGRVPVKELLGNPLVTNITFPLSEGKDIKRMLIKETFLESVQQFKIRSQQHNIRNLATKFSIIILALVLIIGVLSILMNLYNKKANRNYGLVYVAYDIDSINNKTDALQLVKYIYDKNWNTENEKNKLESKFLELLRTPDVQSQFAIYSDTLLTTNLKYDDIDISQSGNFIVLHVFNDSAGSADAGNFEVIDITNHKIQNFAGIGYAYFTNHLDSVLLIKTSAIFNRPNAQVKQPEDTLIFYDCRNNKTYRKVTLGNGRFLYPAEDTRDHLNNEFDSWRVRYTASGNLVIPFLEKNNDNTFGRKVGIWFKDKDSIILNSDMSISLSKDRRTFMAGMYLNLKKPVISIYEESGRMIDTLQNTFLSDFTPLGSVAYIGNDSTLIIRQINSLSENKTVKRRVLSKSPIEYAYINEQETLAVLSSKDLIYLQSLTKDERPTEISGRLVYVNIKDNLIVVSKNSTYDSIKKIYLDSVFKRNLINDQTLKFACPAGIKDVKYNLNRDEVLVFTKDYKLLLLDQNLKLKASFQLTPNDLFGFSKNGNKIFYVRDKLLSVFMNDNNLIDVFDFSKGYNWLENNKKLPELSKDKIRDYHLSFK